MEQKKEREREETQSFPKKSNMEDGVLNLSNGAPLDEGKNSLTAGPFGPVLMQDHGLIDKIQHFTREKTPPRNVHALGTGAYGYFTATNSEEIKKYTNASLFQGVGKRTPIFVRFSGIFTEVGDPDTTRDPRGFAIKFYTEEGNWDLLAINTPVFNVRDMKMGPDTVHAFKRDPRSGNWHPTQTWDYVATHPEGLHMMLMVYSNRDGTPLSYRHMNAFGCNTFSFINEEKKRVWVKFHIISTLGAKGLTAEHAKLVAGEDPNFLSRDLRQAIERGEFPKWKFAVQIMKEEDGYTDPRAFDCTKSWPHSEFPLIDLGELTLNKNPVDFHAEVEQVAFSPANTVPGIGYSPDKLLQGRLLVYDDTQFHRLGPNFKQIPINCPLKPATTMYVGGQHNQEIRNKYPHYWPNSFNGPHPDPRLVEPGFKCDGPAGYYNLPHEGTDFDYYQQARDFLEVMEQDEKKHLYLNIACSLEKVVPEVREKMMVHFNKIDNTLAKSIEGEMTARKTGKKSKTLAERTVEMLDKFLGNNAEVAQ